MIKGVYDRLIELRDVKDKDELRQRPPYIHQIPLEFIPKLGPKTLERLLDHFGNEMNILHNVSIDALREVVPDSIAQAIHLAREGKLSLTTGGAGKYGRVNTK